MQENYYKYSELYKFLVHSFFYNLIKSQMKSQKNG